MTIRFSKYSPHWQLVRNGFKFRRCCESKKTIWPYQKMYMGKGYVFPSVTFWLSTSQYVYLKLKGDI